MILNVRDGFLSVMRTNIEAIDVHAHYGVCDRPEMEMQSRFLSADAEKVAQRAAQANIQITIVSPLLGLMPRGEADATVGNDEAARIVPRHPELRQWVIIDPRNALRILSLGID